MRKIVNFLLVGFLLSGILMLQGCVTRSLSNKQQKKLHDQVIVITGATSGLGQGIALQAAVYQAKVVVVARNREACNEVAVAVRALGGEALPVAADVSVQEDMERLVREVMATYGRIDIWINNAGVAAIGALWKTPLADHMRVLDVNLKGLLHGSYLAVQQFRAQGYGTLVNIGSIESEIPTAYQASYAASKAGVRALGFTLRQELRLAGFKEIQVITVSPWALDTPLWGHVATYTGHQPRMILMDPPSKAVNAVLRSALSKRREVPVGLKAHIAIGAHRLFPALTERLGSNLAHTHQASKTPLAADTTGNLYNPTPTGEGVEGGYREKMKQERKQRKTKKP